MQKKKWEVCDDGEGLFVWHGGGSPHDESLPVYLPVQPRIRARAAQVIADALNAAKIPRPRKPRAPKQQGSEDSQSKKEEPHA